MGKETKIEWCDHTFNPWIGCAKVSPGCVNCYADQQDKFRKWTPEGWGAGKPRRRTKAEYWKQPRTWDKQWSLANKWIQTSDRPRVFCASLSDWLDDEVPIEWLADLLMLIHVTPNLDWLLLTKRPQNFHNRVKAAGRYFFGKKENQHAANWIFYWLEDGHAPHNVWIGTTVEDQARAEERVPHLLQIPARVRFLSCEPLLGPVDLTAIEQTVAPGFFGDCLQWHHRGKCHEDEGISYPTISWVICGGESGRDARPMHPDWARSLRDQCQRARVPFLFKQWGEWAEVCAQYPVTEAEQIQHEEAGGCGDIALESDGTIAQGYQPITERCWLMSKTGKSKAGRLLDGREWNEFPNNHINQP